LPTRTWSSSLSTIKYRVIILIDCNVEQSQTLPFRKPLREKSVPWRR